MFQGGLYWGLPDPLGGEGNGTPLQSSRLENPRDGAAWWAAVHGVAKSRTRLSDFTFSFHVHALEKEMAAHSSVPAWRIPGMAEPGGLRSMGPHRVGHDCSDSAAAAAAADPLGSSMVPSSGRISGRESCAAGPGCSPRRLWGHFVVLGDERMEEMMLRAPPAISFFALTKFFDVFADISYRPRSCF